MAIRISVASIRIDRGCIACGSCEALCPEVFEAQEETCVIRGAALDAGFLRSRSQAIIEAAEACPVQVIRLETVRVPADEAPGPERVSRRCVISAGGAGWLALGGGAVLGGLAVQRFMFPNVLEEPDPRVRVGALRQYAEMAVGGVCESLRPQGIWIVRLDGRVAALSTTCTHLGCLTDWAPDERRFNCPCHGSVFLQEGINVQGPAPRALDRLGIRVEDGIVVVDRSRRFRRERGEWESPDSFIAV